MRVNLWDTRFYIGEMSNADDILKEWEPYLQDDSYISDSMWTMAETKSSIRNEKNKELPWNVFFESVRPHMNTFLESLDPQVPYNVFCDEMWFNKYEKGDYQEPHDHAFPGRGISVIYFLDFPDQEKEPGGTLVFECPNFQMIRATGMDRIFNDYNYQHITPPLKKGTLIIFPSYISHYVLPNKTDKRRATIAANFVITAADKKDE
mgnify:FL=1|tara:strand:+ start:436 stop:1053 length:618 start_codon:yes stop_codon:yes gene_type:complete